MIRLKVFVSSVQKELRAERLAVGSLLATDEFLRQSTVPRLFEDYPAPLRPNPRAYLDMLRTCHVYLLIVGNEYGRILKDDLSATHQEYRLALELKMPMLVCIKGDRSAQREERTEAFLAEVEKDGHSYSRFQTEAELLEAVRDRLKEHIQAAYDTVPKPIQEEQAAESRRSASPFERQLISSLFWEDLDLDQARELAAAAEDVGSETIAPAALPQLLHARGYLWWDLEASRYRPTVAGLLLLAKNPALALPQARIQLDAFANDGATEEAVDAVFVDAPLFDAVKQAVSFVQRNTQRPMVIKGLQRERSLYPPEALREALVNAVAHRDYSEAGAKISVEVFPRRLRVSSPGQPVGGEKIEVIAAGQARSRARNPLIVQGLTWLGLMDERGSGIRRMLRAHKAAGQPPPRFTIDRDTVTVELALAEVPAPVVDAELETTPMVESNGAGHAEAAIRKLLENESFVTTSTCVQRLGVSRDTAWRALTRMVEEGKLEKSGTGRGTRYRLK